MNQVIIIGGTINNTLNKWLGELGIGAYTHYGLNVEDISPEALQEYANRLYNSIPISAIIISVGKTADKLLNLAFILHAALPDTRIKDRTKIQEALKNCKSHLTLRRYYGSNSPAS